MYVATLFSKLATDPTDGTRLHLLMESQQFSPFSLRRGSDLRTWVQVARVKSAEGKAKYVPTCNVLMGIGDPEMKA